MYLHIYVARESDQGKGETRYFFYFRTLRVFLHQSNRGEEGGRGEGARVRSKITQGNMSLWRKGFSRDKKCI